MECADALSVRSFLRLRGGGRNDDGEIRRHQRGTSDKAAVDLLAGEEFGGVFEFTEPP